MVYDSIAVLAREVHSATWTGCSGFSAGSLILLNDSTGPNGAQEYAVLRNGRQIESITVSWIELPDLIVMLEGYDRDGSTEDMGPCVVLPHVEGSCEHCA